MIQWIRSHDSQTPLYLCMEEFSMWKEVLPEVKNIREIETYLIKGKDYNE